MNPQSSTQLRPPEFFSCFAPTGYSRKSTRSQNTKHTQPTMSLHQITPQKHIFSHILKSAHKKHILLGGVFFIGLVVFFCLALLRVASGPVCLFEPRPFHRGWGGVCVEGDKEVRPVPPPQGCSIEVAVISDSYGFLATHQTTFCFLPVFRSFSCPSFRFSSRRPAPNARRR